MNKILASNYQIRFDDCDAFQHLNNRKYLSIFFTEREDHEMLQIGFDMYVGCDKEANEGTFLVQDDSF